MAKTNSKTGKAHAKAVKRWREEATCPGAAAKMTKAAAKRIAEKSSESSSEDDTPLANRKRGKDDARPTPQVVGHKAAAPHVKEGAIVHIPRSVFPAHPAPPDGHWTGTTVRCRTVGNIGIQVGDEPRFNWPIAEVATWVASQQPADTQNSMQKHTNKCMRKVVQKAKAPPPPVPTAAAAAAGYDDSSEDERNCSDDSDDECVINRERLKIARLSNPTSW